jgi:predicted metal-dependent peptidase
MTREELEHECLEALAVARAYLCKKSPYFSSALYGLVPKILPGLLSSAGGGFGVTKGMVLYIDPEWFLGLEATLDPKLDVMEKRRALAALHGGLLAHEIMHVLRDIERLESMPDKELANIAFDLPINDDLEKAGYSLPAGGCYPRTFELPEGLTGEQYYDLLSQKQKQKKVQEYCGGKYGKGTGQGHSSQKNDNGDKSDTKGEGKGGQKQDKRGPAAGQCGSCGGHSISPELEQQLDAEVGRGTTDVKRLRTDTLREIKNAAMGRGTVPGSLKELLTEKPGRSVVPWRLKLARVVRKATGRIICGQADYSMRRPSKKSYTRGIIRPGMVDRRVEIGFVRDSSGSMGQAQFKAVSTEVEGVFRQLGITDAWFLDADTRVASVPKRIRIRDLATLPVHGRGGTDFRPAIKRMRELRPKPDLCIYLTDGDGVAPEFPPQDMEVVWCIVPTSNGRKPARWGHLVIISDDQKLREPYE